MIKKSVSKPDKKLIIFYGLIFCGFAALIYLVPYTHDDWAWGSEVGLQRLASNFVDYNGRYFGNYMILALTRSKLLQIVIVAFSALLLCCLPGIFYGKNTVVLTLFSAMLVLLMPKKIFVQTIVWASGYSNYAPPILTTVLYFVLIKNIFGEEKPEYKKFIPLVTLVLGISGSLFMEHVTLYNLAISFLIVLFVLVKFKKMYLTHIAFASGCLAGTVLMFTNTAYGLIAGANDAQGGYRSTALSGNLIGMIKSNVEIVGEELFIKNTAILFVISVLMILLAASFIRRPGNKNKKTVALGCLFVNILCLIIIFTKSKYEYWGISLNSEKSELITLLLLTAVMIFYCLSVLALVVLAVSDKGIMEKLLLLLISVPTVTVPLVVVSPISSRCFLPHYFLLLIFCTVLLGYIMANLKLKITVTKVATVSFAAVTVALSLFMFNIYSTVNHYENKRHEYIQKQIANGETVVKLCELPNSTYVYIDTPKEKMWIDRFKMFYTIDSEIEFETLQYSEFDKWAEEYDAKEVEK